MKLLSLLAAALLALPSGPLNAPVAAQTLPKGQLLIIGGGPIPASIVKSLITHSGGPKGRIVIFPHASSEPGLAAANTRKLIEAQGASTVDVYGCIKGEMDKPECLAQIDNAAGIFFTGGDQNQLMAALDKTQAVAHIRKRHANGALIAGTSAGAAIMSEVMLTGDEKRPESASRIDPETQQEMEPFASIGPGRVVTAKGLGLVTRYIVDQHFIVRKRQNRLISIVLEQPKLIGVGIDESTAILVKPDQSFEVLGDSSVTVIDARTAGALESTPNQNFYARSLTLHLLPAGQKFYGN